MISVHDRNTTYCLGSRALRLPLWRTCAKLSAWDDPLLYCRSDWLLRGRAEATSTAQACWSTSAASAAAAAAAAASCQAFVPPESCLRTAKATPEAVGDEWEREPGRVGWLIESDGV